MKSGREFLLKVSYWNFEAIMDLFSRKLEPCRPQSVCVESESQFTITTSISMMMVIDDEDDSLRE